MVKPLRYKISVWNGRKQAWSADPTRRNWQFNKRNVKNCSLPGDVAFISGQPIDVPDERGGPEAEGHFLRSLEEEQSGRTGEECTWRRWRGKRREATTRRSWIPCSDKKIERGSDVQRQGYRQR